MPHRHCGGHGAREQALRASLANVPVLPDRTLVLVDRSGSMFASLSRRGQLTRADAAAVFGAALAERAAAADLVEFGTSSKAVKVGRGASVLTVAGRMAELGGTETAEAVRRHLRGHDRVVLITDEQAWGGYRGADPTSVVPAHVPVYTFNVAGLTARCSSPFRRPAVRQHVAWPRTCGHLLRKHPGTMQVFDVAVVSGRVFYSEATDERCTAALLVEVDPTGLVRGRKGPAADGFALGRYIDDRPYAASSMLAVRFAANFPVIRVSSVRSQQVW